LAYANSLKTFIVLIYTPIPLLVFILHGDIHYGLAVLFAIGNTLAGWFAADYITKMNTTALKWILSGILIVFIAYLFGAFNVFIG
jgi:uncharacterized membrane protein YfcA